MSNKIREASRPQLSVATGDTLPSLSSLLDGTPEIASSGFVTDNQPNARKMINSMRRLGYNNYSAVKDILDNSIDADAQVIKVSVDRVKPDGYTITIVDNGNGMDWHTLDQALRLGSETERNTVSDLGKFGMGLVTASLSICRRVEVLTKQKSSPILHSIQDVDEIERKNEFIKYLEEANADAQTIFQAYLPNNEHGTIIRLLHCDQLGNSQAHSFTNILKREIGQTYRIFLSTGQRKIFVNNEEIQPIDPLMLTEGGEIRSDDYYPIKYRDETNAECQESIRVRIALLPDFGKEGNSERKMNILTQGFYLLRNQREIADGETFGVFTTHNNLNRFRAEIYFSAALDDAMGVDFTKQKPEPKQAILDKLREITLPQTRSILKQLQSTRSEAANDDVKHDEAARQISQKAHLLVKPKQDVEQRASSTHSDGRRPESQGGTKERENFTETQKKPAPLPCRFDKASMTAAGPIWEAEQHGKTVVIIWNVDHPFYQRFILENKDNLDIVNATDYLVYSLAAAELAYTPNDDEDTYRDRQTMMTNIRGSVASNMRSLLS